MWEKKQATAVYSVYFQKLNIYICFDEKKFGGIYTKMMSLGQWDFKKS